MKPYYQYPFSDLVVFQTPNLWQTYRNYNYILARGTDAIVIDPGDKDPILKTIEDNQLKIQGLYLTHHHQDHTGATRALQKVFDCPVVGFAKDHQRLPVLSQSFADGDTLEILGHKAEVMHLPGHTLGLCAFYFQELKLLFSNDLLFSLGCGRVFEGTFPQMFDSLKTVRDLPDDTWVFCSHEYTEQNLHFGRHLFPKDEKLLAAEKVVMEKVNKGEPTVPTTLGFEKTHNPFLRWDDPSLRQSLKLEAAEDWQVFAEIRRLKDLA